MEVFKIEDFGGEIYLIPKPRYEGIDICRDMKLDEEKTVFVTPSIDSDWRMELCREGKLFFPDVLRAMSVFLRLIRGLPASDYEIETQRGRAVLKFIEGRPIYDYGGSIGRCKLLRNGYKLSFLDAELDFYQVLTPLGVYRVAFCDSTESFDMNTLGPLACKECDGVCPRGIAAVSYAGNGVKIKTYIFAEGSHTDTCAFAAVATAAREVGLSTGSDITVISENGCGVCLVSELAETLVYSINPQVSKLFSK